MDYKELIENLNQYSAEHQNHGGISARAADAITDLLARTEEAEARAEKAEREGCVKKDLDYYKYQRQHPITRFGFSEKEEQP